MLALATAVVAASMAAALEVRPASAKPGDAVLLIARGVAAEPSATLEGRAVRFWRAGAEWRAIAGLPVEAHPGQLPIGAGAGGAELRSHVTVVDPAFASRELTVPPRYVEPPASVRRRIAADQQAFNEAFARPFTEPRFAEPFSWPLLAETTGHYGDRRTYNGRQQSQHYGLDLDAATGTPVLAANDGLVVMVRDTYYAGLAVVLWHGADLYTAYFHLSRADVKPGEVAARGAPIGLTGASGRATGPHLHWGIKVGGRWVDPESVLRLGAFAADRR
jgi:murein DD-endopeptidase MepM/ murein hydrolase activator NlpD